MSILNKEHPDKYLRQYLDGKIAMGLDIGSTLMDQHLRFKRGQMNFVLGLDNVGKTFVVLWYFLCLSVRHDLKWCIWSGENKPYIQYRQLLQMLSGRDIKELSSDELKYYKGLINKWFEFINVDKMYSHRDLIKVFKQSDADGYLIDPLTGLNHDRSINGFDRNYIIANELREWCNATRKTVYVCLHPVTEAARNKYPKGHELEGHVQIPHRSMAEGGQAFANRADDFIVIHRYVQHDIHRYTTLIDVSKVKDTETGGQPTILNYPVRLDFNYGKGFKIGLDEPIKEWRDSKKEYSVINPNNDFDSAKNGLIDNSIFDQPDDLPF